MKKHELIDNSITKNKKQKLSESSIIKNDTYLNQPFEEFFNQHYTKPDFISTFNTAFRKRLPCKDNFATIIEKPYPIFILENIFSIEFLKSVKWILEKGTIYNKKSNDLYEFYQSDDLKNSLEPDLIKLRETIYSPQFIQLISELTGIKLDNTPDLSAHQYAYGNYLLCHDDDIKDDDSSHGRRIAFIFYLVDENWTKEDGGALEFFDIDELGQPKEIVQSIIPKWNSMAFFELSPTSYHQVSEVLTKSKTRLSISGWFHGSLRTRLSNAKFNSPTSFPQSLDNNFYNQHPTINDLVNPIYLTKQGKKKILKVLRREASIELQQFLKEEVYQKLMDSLNNAKWEENPIGPPFIRRYHLINNEKTVVSQSFHQFIYNFFTSTIFTAYLSEITRYEISSLSSEIRQFLPGNYTMIHDQALDHEGLDIVLYCIEDENWNPEWQGGTHYVANEEELLTLWPKRNTLSIVVRDEVPPPARYKYFISRRGDIGLAIFTGTLAYYFNELENPVVQNDPEKTLIKLTGRRIRQIFSITEN
ncbi:1773_t:CDS:2 [Diversispora eburnea]|uniref:1773_t:CDS:1 n=1 Tax=Diversispora eburnea TaxID=1213867 RepID=A0A9N8V0N2_9GLOM|nr:1773_t:CDS:2 [Diversispora eburnea]